jgi:hypothetical protein
VGAAGSFGPVRDALAPALLGQPRILILHPKWYILTFRVCLPHKTTIQLERKAGWDRRLPGRYQSYSRLWFGIEPKSMVAKAGKARPSA